MMTWMKIADGIKQVYVGAKPVFADSGPVTFNISSRDIQEKITKKTKALVIVH